MADVAIQSIRVLVVDDQAAMRKIVRHLLAQFDVHDWDEAENGEQAMGWLSNADSPDPDVIICDPHMDKMDGSQFCQRVRMKRPSTTATSRSSS